METYRWLIRDAASHVNPSIQLLNNALRKAGGQARVESTAIGSCLVIELGEGTKPAGRPRREAKEDLTVAQVLHARFMNVPMTEIAQTLGVSVRTLHRRWKTVTQAHIHPDTPYSQWP